MQSQITLIGISPTLKEPTLSYVKSMYGSIEFPVVATIVKGTAFAGSYQITFPGLPAGIYSTFSDFFRIKES